MFGRKPKLPVTSEEANWIDKSFLLLVDLFGVDWVRNAPMVLPTERFFPLKYEPTEAWASFAFDCVCKVMKVERERVELIFGEDTVEHLRKTGLDFGRIPGIAGLYRKVDSEEGPSKAQIHIKDSLFKEPESMIAVMTHELSHVLLLGDEKIERDMEKMEPLTDLMTVFSGFGVFNANASHVHKSGSHGWSVSNHGYLSQSEFAYALAVFAWTRGERDPGWQKELSTNVRVFMKDTLGVFKATGRI
ncbi:MAG TPA: hypothetical protein VGL56_14500 [Fimbriimonadaceae bacterium]|jgi:hypothetical protein